MTATESNRRIKFAYQMHGWSFEDGLKANLKANGVKLIPTEYKPEMDGTLFCPVCFTNLNRVPKEKDRSTNGRDAYFSHIRKYKDIKCDLRSVKPVGKKYDSWEEAKKAIDDENLVIISGFLEDKPELKDSLPSVYDETPVEDIDGPDADVPIGRHTGEIFTLPSKITTIAGLCRNFDESLYKYFYLPGKQHAIRLIDLLTDVQSISEECDEPRLYFGRIVKTVHLGEYKKPTNFRMTYLENEADGVQDFCLKSQDQDQKAHGIHDGSVGRILIAYGTVKSNGTGLCFQGLNWGEYGLLPEKYNYLLD